MDTCFGVQAYSSVHNIICASLVSLPVKHVLISWIAPNLRTVICLLKNKVKKHVRMWLSNTEVVCLLPVWGKKYFQCSSVSFNCYRGGWKDIKEPQSCFKHRLLIITKECLLKRSCQQLDILYQHKHMEQSISS